MVNTTRAFRVGLAMVLVCVCAVAGAATALAAEPAFRVYGEQLDSVSAGSNVAFHYAIQNVGGQPTHGPVYIVDRVSSGLSELNVDVADSGHVSTAATYSPPGVYPYSPLKCEARVGVVECESQSVFGPGGQMVMFLNVNIPANASGTFHNSITVYGGGVSSVLHADRPIVVGPPGPFGFTTALVELLNENGTQDVQAGSDPAEYTTDLHWRNLYELGGKETPVLSPVERFKDVIAHLPPGFVGNPSATPALCTPDELAQVLVSGCPPDSQVGLAHIGISWTGLFNMPTPYGVSAELGFQLDNTNVLLYAYVRPGDHGIDVVSKDTSTSLPVPDAEITVWGDPSDPSHDRYRAAGCLDNNTYEGPTGSVCPTTAPRKAFLRMPTSCSGRPLEFGVESNSYEKPEEWGSASMPGPTLTGCEVLPFNPSITIDPTGTAANSPTGVSVKLSLPQNQNPDGLATADLKKAVVTLPEGMAINPSSADGLQVCDDAHLHLDSNVPAECPDGSKLGTVVLHTQLIANPIEGSIYVRPQNSSDPTSGELFRIVFELRDDAHGLDFKIPGHIAANPVTGRLTTTFDDNPQFPFEDISLNFKSGARAPLVTPASCLTQTVETDMYSWAQPEVPVHRSNSFQLTSGPGGTPCPPPVPFNPSLSAGVGNVEAGNYTPFLVTFSRTDADQSMQRVSVKMPKGLLGSLVGIPLCPEAQANAGTCSSASQIGSFTAGAGAGPTPFYVTGGRVYMTGPYEGGPFGLSIVIPAKAGPFDLGTVVTRARVEVDVHTAQLTVTTDPLPQVVGGVPVNLRLVNVTINRPNFTYNPTNCDHTEVTGTMTGGQGAVATLSKGFQVTNCGALGFKPKFTVAVSGRTSRAAGASLDAKLVYPKAPFGSQANIGSVKVSLPKQLPSRLTTLQKACAGRTFERDPAACPAPSRIGTATATTPVLPVPLSGPVYFVSHGGEAFPDLVVVLQGYGVTVDLVGSTFINEKTNVTSTTFKTIPDVPVGTFELKLPQGPYSALAANGNLCKGKLTMPTSFIAQDGMKLNQATPIRVSGCAKSKKAKRTVRHRKGARRSHH